MAKLYTKKTLSNPTMVPKRQTIDFILNYSKALNVLKIGKLTVEVVLN